MDGYTLTPTATTMMRVGYAPGNMTRVWWVFCDCGLSSYSTCPEEARRIYESHNCEHVPCACSGDPHCANCGG